MKALWILAFLLLTACSRDFQYLSTYGFPYCTNLLRSDEALYRDVTPCIGWRIEQEIFARYPSDYVRIHWLRGAVPIQTLILIDQHGTVRTSDLAR